MQPYPNFYIYKKAIVVVSKSTNPYGYRLAR
ncbi:hypothetical protein SAMN05216167_109192 [Spirosoma endophyticum]|uniref:Uncharacterized protein n=1 Tax=Spirosoma endophyticum TaxID=662367 RepID=A0A1I1X7B6_9BACT|nr:hypothetical protein SAMN05216167_109192 [Spirosoma endophyticum]